ncbi:MAG TPA: hypothetical protein VGV93_09125 [Acidimicrobiales bacterium]|nr:hypothetical protein [Acidimicrobiales bacterium]
MQQSAQSPHELPAVLRVTPIIDPVVEAHGFGPNSAYIEYVWLAVLGPSGTWTYRRLNAMVVGRTAEDAVPVNVVDLSRSLGLGAGTGRNSIMARTLNRLVHFGVARWMGEDGLAVRRALAPVPARQLARLSFTPQAMHNRLTAQ